MSQLQENNSEEFVHLFTYGTLMRTEPRHTLLENTGIFKGIYDTEFPVYDMVCLMRDYPALLGPESKHHGFDPRFFVRGELYEIPASLLRVLDKIERASDKVPLFRRSRITLRSVVDDKSPYISAVTYMGNPQAILKLPHSSYRVVASVDGKTKVWLIRPKKPSPLPHPHPTPVGA